MHDGGDQAILAQLLLEEIHGMLEEAADLAFLLALEKLRAGGDQRLHDPNAVTADTRTVILLDQRLGHDAVFVRGLYDVEVVLAAVRIHVGITGVFLLCALIVGLNIADLRPLVFGEAQDGELSLIHQRSLRFCHTRS